MSITIKLQVFEGPLDLLLHLIDKAEVDIYDIPIAEITKQYIEYIEIVKQYDLEIASEFLVMAATLLEIKSKMLLPKPKKENKEEEIDPREELVQKLLEYKKYKEVSAILKDKLSIYEKVFYKTPEPIEDFVNDLDSLSGVTIDALVRSFHNLMQKNNVEKRSSHREIFRDMITVDDKIKHVSKFLISKSKFFFEDLFMEDISKYEIIVTFLAILELLKRKSILIEQDGNFDRILIKRRIN